MNLSDLLATANSFARTSCTIKDAKMLLTPYVVNSVFACEVYSKGLLLLQGLDLKKLKYDEQHQLVKLYSKLEDCTKEKIKTLVRHEFINSKDEFENYLKGYYCFPSIR